FQVRTLFVSGLPLDAKPRELYLLFRAYEGYESSLLKMTSKNGKTQSQGVRFDPDLPQTLRLEFAKSNTKVSKPKQQSPQPAATHPTLVYNPFAAPSPAVLPEGWAHHPLTAAYTHELAPAAIPHHALIHPALHAQTQRSFLQADRYGHFTDQQIWSVDRDIVELPYMGPVYEEKVKCFPGYRRLRMHNKGGSPVAFVEFEDIRSATQGLHSLQGFTLLSSERGGMRIEYAKHKMGETGHMKEEMSGQSPVPPTANGYV
ncbi:PREDICTED: RNA-binding protein with multiple splicing 2-like, partial [Priapulus caudatus]|uniref:RNA-binding protein with multiple splicing 2-like n=1 Tax=Priapulus caudatus TaxID=37621 RepID=A0ABM1E3P0_PRICU